MKTTKLYLSGAISNTNDYIERFSKADKELKSKGYSVINPAITLSHMPGDTTYEEYMKLAITLLGMCDGIYMLDGWQKSKGSNREYGYALAKDMLILYESEGAE